MSASSEGSGESAHCAGSTEPSSFVNLIKLYQIFMQLPIKCCMKLCRHEHDNISGKQIEYAIPVWAHASQFGRKCVSLRGFQSFQQYFPCMVWGSPLDCTDII